MPPARPNSVRRGAIWPTPPTRLEENSDQTPTHYDVVVIGAGIVGSAIARELAGHDLSVALLEARDDVGDGTSKANTAILHTGFDAKPGTLESAMVSRGYQLLSEYARHTGIPVEHTGAVLVAWDAEQLDALPVLQTEGRGQRVPPLRDHRRRSGLRSRSRISARVSWAA